MIRTSELTASKRYIEARSLAHLRSPKDWVNWPVQTVKKWKDGTYLCGLVFVRDDIVVPVVYEVNLFMLSETDLDTVPQYKFVSIDEMVLDGWIVD